MGNERTTPCRVTWVTRATGVGTIDSKTFHYLFGMCWIRARIKVGEEIILTRRKNRLMVAQLTANDDHYKKNIIKLNWLNTTQVMTDRKLVTNLLCS
ncbi:hypothetical protein CEXT_18691 [Caerostris extrusa]|uniref:Uncharacterized protein n=1 Tax=Caerostris extrusa TaxID=172846 RepID=A0AAV4Q1H0_CAEEX|nr:hypothetical protein CEXT_18691 [Caerostris extrusa]